MAKRHVTTFNGLVDPPINNEFSASLKNEIQKNRYRIVIYLANNSTRIFENCTYSTSPNCIQIRTADEIQITFFGSFCAEIGKMEDFDKMLK